MSRDWPFQDPPKTAVFTTRRIITGGHPILFVTHDEEDGAWQFHDGHQVEDEKPLIVSLLNIANRDSSILELGDLALGWHAWRTDIHAPWQRARKA